MATTSRRSAVVTLPTDTAILITRDFDAPPRLVYKVFTTPELISRWWAGQKGQITSVEVDLRVGGSWRYAMEANGGFEVAFNGEFRQIVPNELIVCTEVFEAMPDVEPSVCTYTFVDRGERTTLELLAEYGSQEVRDAVVGSGMEDGMQEGWDIADEIAVSLA
ncbi:SRPBCC family protein [soil metagenome]